MDGFKPARKIRPLQASQKKNTFITAVTADAMKGAREKCLASGMNDYVSKPIEMDKLTSVLHQWLTHDQTEKEMGASAPAVPTDVPAEKVMDWDHFTVFTDNDPEQEFELINLFITYGAETLQAIVDAQAAADSAAFRAMCHKLKGSAANLGAQALSKAAEAGEMGASGREGDRARLLATIQGEYTRVSSELQQRLTTR